MSQQRRVFRFTSRTAAQELHASSTSAHLPQNLEKLDKMPPFGLYQISRHHQSNTTHFNRPTYNTNDFVEKREDAKREPEPVDMPQTDGQAEGQGKKERDEAKKMKKERKEKKRKKHRDSEGHRDFSEKGATTTTAHETAHVTGITPTTNAGANVKAKRSKDDKTKGLDLHAPQTPAKKRKRESDVNGGNPKKVDGGLSHASDTSFMTEMIARGLGTVVHGNGANALFSTHTSDAVDFRGGNNAGSEKKKSKKKKRRSESNADGSNVTVNVATQPSSASADNKGASTEKKSEKKCRKSEGDVTNKDNVTKSKKEKKKGEFVISTDAHDKITKAPLPAKNTPVPLPTSLPNGTRKASSPMKHTPVPIPKPSSLSAFSAIRAANEKKTKVASTSSEVQVPETPPSKKPLASQHPFKTAIPFPSSRLIEAANLTPRSERKKRLTHVLSCSDLGVDEDNIVPAPPSTKKADEILRKCGITSPKKYRVTEPLKDEPKPRPRGRSSSGSSSTGTSDVSSRSSSVSIPDLFNRVNKPYARSGAYTDPFTTISEPVKNDKGRETHEEASHHVFEKNFSAIQSCVNFSIETDYLEHFLAWRSENTSESPFPCLGKFSSGCTPKKEELLRLSKEEHVNILSALDISGGSDTALKNAIERSTKAEKFLTMAIFARVPVPIGKLEGTWTLYCPKYAADHFDKYGYGMRTFTMSPIAGFKDRTTFVARLSIPPRSMSYTILSFNVPPHASFRATTIKTSTEGYKMDIVFLGNGYMHLRVDLGLLLKGRPTEMVGGKKVFMEFVGVHEKAETWEVNQERDELEVEGRKLFAKYGGVDEE